MKACLKLSLHLGLLFLTLFSITAYADWSWNPLQEAQNVEQSASQAAQTASQDVQQAASSAGSAISSAASAAGTALKQHFALENCAGYCSWCAAGGWQTPPPLNPPSGFFSYTPLDTNQFMQKYNIDRQTACSIEIKDANYTPGNVWLAIQYNQPYDSADSLNQSLTTIKQQQQQAQKMAKVCQQKKKTAIHSLV